MNTDKYIHANALPFALLCLFDNDFKAKESALQRRGFSFRLTVTRFIDRQRKCAL